MRAEEEFTASDALLTAQTAEGVMRRGARSIRPPLAIVGLASGAVTAGTLLPEPWTIIVSIGAFVAILFSAWLAQRSVPRRLIAQPGQHLVGRLLLVGAVVLVPLAGIAIATYTGYTWVVVGLAIAVPTLLIAIPWWWERDLRRPTAAS